MHKYNTTDWFDADVKPARPGVYQVKSELVNTWFRYFDGVNWYFGSGTPVGALRERDEFQEILENFWSWRGITNDWIDASILPEFDGVYRVQTPCWAGNTHSFFHNGEWKLCTDSRQWANRQTKSSNDMKKPQSKYKLYED